MLKNLLTVGGWTMLSRLLGLLRDLLLAMFLGAGPIQDAYQIAARLPNMFRRLFGEGAFNAAFVPIFTSIYGHSAQEAGPETGRKQALLFASQALLFASQAFTLLAIWLSLLAILGEIFMPTLIGFIAPGFAPAGSASNGSLGRFELAVSLTRITLPYMVLICLSALVSGILNGRNHFGAASAAYISFNIVGITAILGGVLSSHFSGRTALSIAHKTAFWGAWGVTLSGIVQLAGLLWAAHRLGLMPGLCWPSFSPKIRLLMHRMAPGLVGSGVTQLNLTVDTIIGTLLPTGSISWLYFADRLNQLPLGVLGSALGTTLLPLLTRHANADDRPAMQTSLNNALDYALILTLPASWGLLSLAPEITGGLFGYGHFSNHDVLATSQSLYAYAAGLPAFVMIKLLAPGFFAEGDTVTPVKIGFFTLFLNLILNLLLYRPLAHIGPPLASTISALVNMGILAIILWRRRVFRPNRTSLYRTLLIMISAGLMSLWAIGAAHYWVPSLRHGPLWLWPVVPRLSMLFFLIGSSALLYGLCLISFGIIPRSLFKRLLK